MSNSAQTDTINPAAQPDQDQLTTKARFHGLDLIRSLSFFAIATFHISLIHYYTREIYSEIDENLPAGEDLDQGTLRKLERLDWALRETERTDPVASMLIRTVKEAFDLNGYQIPEGWVVFLSPAVSHRIPEIFQEPDRWDPSRFAPGRQEDRIHPYSLVGFGGGPHKCLGMNFAYTEMKVIFSLLLKRYQLELLDPDPQSDRGSATGRPERPCLILYQKR